MDLVMYKKRVGKMDSEMDKNEVQTLFIKGTGSA